MCYSIEDKERQGKECSEVSEHSDIPRHSASVPKSTCARFGPQEARVDFGTDAEWQGISECSDTSEHSFPCLSLSSIKRK